MEQAIKNKRIAWIVSLASLVLAAVFVFFSIKCIKEPLYLVMAVLAVLAAVCCYLSVFMFFAFIDARAMVKLLSVINRAKMGRIPMDIVQISSVMGWRKETTAKFIEKCRKKGYMR